VYERVARARQTEYIKTYQDMDNSKKAQAAAEGRVKKCCRLLGKIIVGLIIFAFAYPILRTMLYKTMGWEMPKPTMPTPSGE
jgi:hypothetical protein